MGGPQIDHLLMMQHQLPVPSDACSDPVFEIMQSLNHHAQSVAIQMAQYTYRYDLDPPATLKDYHWLCHHFMSGDASSCKAGKSCLYRHYDFESRADVLTAWDVALADRYEPNFKELEIAKQLKQRMEAKYWWLAQDGASDNEMDERHPEHETAEGQEDDRVIMSKHDYKIMIALLSTFEKERDEDADYFTMGRLAIDHLRTLGDK